MRLFQLCIAGVVCFAACGPTPTPPQKPATSVPQASSPTTATPSAPDASPTATAEMSDAAAAPDAPVVDDETFCAGLQQPNAPKCHWRTVVTENCGGAKTKPHRTCVCDFCLADADCKARGAGKCVPLTSTGYTCTTSNVCVYPHDACYDPKHSTCPQGKWCQPTADGRGECVAPFLPPQTARPHPH